MSRERLRIPHRTSHTADNLDDSTDDDGFESESQADERWGRSEIDPSDSASATAEYSVHHSHHTTRQPSRQHSVPRPRPAARYPSHPAVVPAPPTDYIPTMPSESDFYGPGGYPPHAPPPGGRYPYNYQPSTVGGHFAPPSHHAPYGAQMVHYGAPHSANPFQPHGYFDEPRHAMMPYQQQYAAPYSPGAMVPPNYYPNYPPPPPATDVATRPKTPVVVEDKKPDPEFIKMKQELESMQMERQRAAEAAARTELEKKIREEEERKLKDRMDAMRIAQEDAKKEIELAKIAAEAAALERLEEARKAEDERRRLEADLRAQAAREEREKIEAERKAEAQRAKEQAAALEKAERDAKEKYEAAKKAEEARLAEMARQKALIEDETKAKILAEQQAAKDAKAAADLKAEAEAKQREVERETLRQKAIQDHEEKLAAEKKAIAEAETAAMAAKQQAHDEFVLKQAEEKKKAEEEAAAAAQAKKDAEDLKAKILEEGKKAAADEAAKATGDDKEPIKFKDAVGRKYSFPWRLAAQWRTMEGLINQAFAHIDGVGQQVREGRYDLEGPEGELILKEIWDTIVQPGWQVTMKMWPADAHPPRNPRGGAMPHIRIPNTVPPEHRAAFMQQQIRMMREREAMGGGGPRPVPGMPGVPPAPFGFPGAGGGRPPPGMGRAANVEVVDSGRPKDKSRKKKPSGWGGIFGTGPAKKSSSKNRKK